MSYLAVFDWNGTLFDDVHANHIGANAALEAFGHPPITLEKYLDTFDFPILHFYKRNGIDTDTYLSHIMNTNSAFLPVYEREAQNCTERAGSHALLKWLKAAGITCIILSNHNENHITTNLARLELDPFFDHLSCNPPDNDIMIKMNKQERLETFMQDHGYAPDKTFIIGDSLEEPQIAKNLGLLSFAITGGCISEARLKKSNPDHLIHNFEQLKTILSQKWSLEI